MHDVHIQTRTDAEMLLSNPELVLQHMSFKIHARREALIRDLIGKNVLYAKRDAKYRKYKLEKIDESGQATITDGSARMTVSVRRLRLE